MILFFLGLSRNATSPVEFYSTLVTEANCYFRASAEELLWQLRPGVLFYSVQAGVRRFGWIASRARWSAGGMRRSPAVCAAENVMRRCDGVFAVPNAVWKTGGGICMRLFTMSGPLVQQPYTVTAYPNVYFYLLGTLADWPLAGDCALGRSFDKNGKISIFMWRIRDNNM